MRQPASMRRIGMDNNNVALITKMVLEAVEKTEIFRKRTGISGTGGRICKTYPLDTGACGSVIRTRISADKEERIDGRTVCLK